MKKKQTPTTTALPQSVQYQFEYNLPNKPVIIVFSANILFCSLDKKKVLDIHQTILKNDNIYLVLNSDSTENYDFYSSKILEGNTMMEKLPPILKRNFLFSVLETLAQKRKLLLFNLNNSKNPTEAEFLTNFNIPVSMNRATINLNFKNFQFVIACINKSQFNHPEDPTYTALKELYTNYPQANAVVTTNNHLPSIKSYYHENSLKWLINTGNISMYNPFIYEANPSACELTESSATPSLIILPHKKKSLSFINLEDTLTVFELIKN